ncbi:cupin [Frankia sp. CNm7]|uniref:Acireductone dioxygenase n=1 Tax=Frankia nepalensis TaxID=1836974 RepID=A0A937RTK0_9ACTN|nr:cupin [Frankia nepalensis]MBL7499925.1 cupin [Frankia nepalensis]MBL7511712.1 cupin [Frankia nepalensis]MBL7523168.1 cupin [Frankia nepalensis]MBL7632528.1 cupin [Frankia nepalensis]
MTALTTWPANDPTDIGRQTSDPVEIAAVLGELGFRFERWPLAAGLPAGAPAEDVLAAYRDPIARIVEAEGFVQVDVASLHPTGAPGFAATAAGARAKFLAEHTHADDEVRFFVAGSGVFYLHTRDAARGEQVHAVLCEAGDLLSVPAGTTHWFDMGTTPSFTAIRFFRDPDGWVGDFTGSDIATRFPDFDALARRAAVAAAAPGA